MTPLKTDRRTMCGPLVDAEPAREHIARLRASGLSIKVISRLSGVSMKGLASLIYGIGGRPPAVQARQDTIDRLAAVNPRLELLSPLTKVGSTGTCRRLQALQAVGWSQRRLAAELGTDAGYVGKLSRSEARRVRVRTAVAVRAVYDRLWDARPPMRTPAELGVVSRMRSMAARRGWAPPMAWDEETIDDPTAEPQGAGYVPGRCKLPEPGEIAHLIAGGDSAEVLADRYDVSVRYVRDRLDQQSEVTA